MDDGRIDLDITRLNAARRAVGTARNSWAVQYWRSVQSNLETNMRTRFRYGQVGGSERLSRDSKNTIWNPY